MRSAADGEPEQILVLSTLGAPQRRFLSGRKGRELTEAEAEPVPTSRATVVRPEPFSGDEAGSWLQALRGDADSADAEVAAALAVLNGAIHAHRTARADPSARDVSERGALVVRIGYGAGDAVADGHFEEAWELPRERRRTRRSMESPEERFAALLGGRATALVAEDLVLRTRADLDAGRTRAAALQARVALEALLAELPSDELKAERAVVAGAANAALDGELDDTLAAGLDRAVKQMEAALRRHRLRT